MGPFAAMGVQNARVDFTMRSTQIKLAAFGSPMFSATASDPFSLLLNKLGSGIVLGTSATFKFIGEVEFEVNAGSAPIAFSPNFLASDAEGNQGPALFQRMSVKNLFGARTQSYDVGVPSYQNMR